MQVQALADLLAVAMVVQAAAMVGLSTVSSRVALAVTSSTVPLGPILRLPMGATLQLPTAASFQQAPMASPHLLPRSVLAAMAVTTAAMGSRQTPTGASKTAVTADMAAALVSPSPPLSRQHQPPPLCGRSSGMERAAPTTTIPRQVKASGRSLQRCPEQQQQMADLAQAGVQCKAAWLCLRACLGACLHGCCWLDECALRDVALGCLPLDGSPDVTMMSAVVVSLLILLQ